MNVPAVVLVGGAGDGVARNVGDAWGGVGANVDVGGVPAHAASVAMQSARGATGMRNRAGIGDLLAVAEW